MTLHNAIMTNTIITAVIIQPQPSAIKSPTIDSMNDSALPTAPRTASTTQIINMQNIMPKTSIF